jgi:small subunit ribosomal protein S7
MELVVVLKQLKLLDEAKGDFVEEGKVLLFNKYDYNEVNVSDITIKPYVYLTPFVIPHTFGRIGFRKKRMEKNIVERLANKLMRGGTGEKVGGKVIRTHGALQGKKAKVLKVIEDAFDIIAVKTKKNPIQVLVDAITNTAPREEVTRVEYGGVRYQVAVDISPRRRVDMALRNIAMAAIMASFAKKETLAGALANELILAANGDVNSYAIKRRDEIERIARSAR